MFKICLNNFASSAYKNKSAPLVQQAVKSLIKIINNNGPRIEPCGIPLRTCLQYEKKPLTRTLCLLLTKKDSIHLIISILILYECSLLINLLCGTLSKAFSRSV